MKMSGSHAPARKLALPILSIARRHRPQSLIVRTLGVIAGTRGRAIGARSAVAEPPTLAARVPICVNRVQSYFN